MKKLLNIAMTGLVASTAFVQCTPAAMAHDRVDWSVSVGSPYYYSPPPVMYSPPPTVYVQRRPVYYEQRMPPVVTYRAPYYGGYERREWRDPDDYERWEHHGRYPHCHQDDD